MSEVRLTSFGHMETIDWGAQHKKVEVLHFEQEGRDHQHNLWENAVCLEGQAEVVINGVVRWAPVGLVFAIPPGLSHRMRPLGESCDWLVWYTEHPPQMADG